MKLHYGKSIIKNNNIIELALISIPFIYISACRDYSIGADTNGIYRLIYFEGYAAHEWKTTMYEMLYIFFVRFLHWIKSDYRFLIVITSIIISALFCYFFIRRQEYINLTIALLGYLVLIYTFSMNAQRQIIAGAICLIIFELLERKKTALAILSIIVASFFHITSIVMFIYLIPYFLSDSIFWKRKILFLFCAGPVILMLLFTYLIRLPFLNKFAEHITVFNFSNINTKSFFLPVLLLPLVIIYSKKLLKFNDNNYLHLCGFLFMFTAVVASGYLWYAFRLMYFFIPSEIIIMSQFGNCAKSKIEKYIVNIYIILSVVITFFVVYVFFDTDAIYPYKFYWE